MSVEFLVTAAGVEAVSSVLKAILGAPWVRTVLKIGTKEALGPARVAHRTTDEKYSVGPAGAEDEPAMLRPARQQQRRRVRDSLPPDLQMPAGRTVIISPTFKLVFWSVLLLTVLSAIGNATLAFGFGPGAPTPNQQTVFDTLNMVWKLGIGVIFGLLGGKAS